MNAEQVIPQIEFASTITTAEDFGTTLSRLTREGWQPSGPMYQEKLENGTYRYVIVSVRQVETAAPPASQIVTPGQFRVVPMN